MTSPPTSPNVPNPFVRVDADGRTLCHLKQSLVLYLDYAPGPTRARRVYDLFMGRFGRHIDTYLSTSWPGPPLPWDAAARSHFEQNELPALQQTMNWGYGFEEAKEQGSHLFMFHGFKPASEPGKASFFRFEWPWDAPPDQLFGFAKEVADSVPFLSGTGGYILQTRPYNNDAYDFAFSKAQRYWGLEAWNLDETVNYVLDGYKCPSWLTLIGNRLIEKLGEPTELSTIDAYRTAAAHGIILRSRDIPEFIDRNRAEPYPGEQAIARALTPLQIKKHARMGGRRWTDDNTLEWLRRFS